MSRIFHISKPKSSSYIVSPRNVNAAGTAFHADLSEYSRDKPAITLRAGPKESAADTAPVLAVSHMPFSGKRFTIGLGDPRTPAGEAAMRWEEMRALNRWCTKYDIEARAVTGTREAAVAIVAGTTLTWKHTRRVMVDGEKESATRAQCWKLVDEGGGVLAIFTGAKPLDGRFECGALQINVDGGKEFEIMVVVMCLTLYEKEQREAGAS